MHTVNYLHLHLHLHGAGWLFCMMVSSAAELLRDPRAGSDALAARMWRCGVRGDCSEGLLQEFPEFLAQGKHFAHSRGRPIFAEEEDSTLEGLYGHTSKPQSLEAFLEKVRPHAWRLHPPPPTGLCTVQMLVSTADEQSSRCRCWSQLGRSRAGSHQGGTRRPVGQHWYLHRSRRVAGLFPSGGGYS